MPDRLLNFFESMKLRWRALTRPQQYKLVGVISVILIMIVVVAYFAFRTRFVPLTGPRDAIEIMNMQNALAAEGIRSRMNNVGGLEVDERRRADAIRFIEVRNLAPREGTFEWDQALAGGLGTTDLDRRAGHNLALQSEIEATLRAMEGITDAWVGISAPTVRPFDQNAPRPSANITLITTRDFSAAEGRNLASIAVRRVPGLTHENVTVIDQSARLIFDGDRDIQDNPAGSAMDAQIQFTQRTQHEVTTGLMNTGMFTSARTVINFVFDNTLYTEELSNIFRNPEGGDSGLPNLSIDSRAEMEGVPGGAAPGMDTNIQAVPGFQIGTNALMSATQRDIEQHLSLDHIQTITQSGPGWVQPESSSAMVSLSYFVDFRQDLWMDEDPERTALGWERFKQDNALGTTVNSSHPSYEVLLTSIAMAIGIPQENISLVITQLPNFIDITPNVWDWPLIAMWTVLALLLLMLAYGLFHKVKTANAEEEEPEPELDVDKLLVTTQLEEQKEEEAKQLEEIDYFKENEVKRHIEKFVNEKPEAVAALLRNWINAEEW